MLSNGSFVHKRMSIGNRMSVGPYAVVGYQSRDDGDEFGRIGNDVEIGPHSVIFSSAIIEDQVTVDAFCRVGSRTEIGKKTRVLYGAQVFADCNIGSNCVVAGEVPDRVVIGDNVTFMGDIAHTYRDASIDWGTIQEPSPVIGRGSVVGMRALLIGPVKIGEGSYVAAGEIVRHDVPALTVVYKGKMSPIQSWRGFIRSRIDEEADG